MQTPIAFFQRDRQADRTSISVHEPFLWYSSRQGWTTSVVVSLSHLLSAFSTALGLHNPASTAVRARTPSRYSSSSASSGQPLLFIQPVRYVAASSSHALNGSRAKGIRASIGRLFRRMTRRQPPSCLSASSLQNFHTTSRVCVAWALAGV